MITNLQNFKDQVLEIKQRLDKVNDHSHIPVLEFIEQFHAEFFGKMIELKKSFDIVTDELKAEATAFIRSELSVIYKAPFYDRCYNKPLGYAGDYAMMVMMYDMQPQGPDFLSQCIHMAGVREAECGAARNRIRYIQEKISMTQKANPGKTIKVLSVASGPAREVMNLVLDSEKLGIDLSTVEIHLLDQDKNSLAHAEETITKAIKQTYSKITVKYINSSVGSILKREFKEEGYDLIYSAGLFDYLNDSTSRKCAQELYLKLSPGGNLVIGNFREGPNRFTMDIIMDWVLIYRTEDELKEMFKEISPAMHIEAEPLTINLFAVFKK